MRGRVEIEGTIRGIGDVEEIKSVIDRLRLEEGETLELEIRDSFSMPSALIGYLLKLAEQQKCNLRVTVDSPVLSELLEDLGLKSLFHLRLKSPASA